MANLDVLVFPMVVVGFFALATATLTAGGFARFGFPLPPAERRIGCIDGLRGYLALTVMLHHFIIWLQVAKLGGLWRAPSVPLFNEFGASSVALFFMTTGLVFYPRILAGLNACNWRAVYTSRFFRLMPAVIWSVALITAVIMMRTGRRPDLSYVKPFLEWISSIFEPPLLGYPDSGRLNAYVMWSLRYEWIFYLALLPACALASDLLKQARLPIWIVPLALISICFLVYQIDGRADKVKFFPAFGLGMIAFEIRKLPRVSMLLRSKIFSLLGGASLLVGITAFSTPYMTGLIFLAIFFACVVCGNDFGGILSTRGALVLGECSFSIYLLHGLVLDIIFVDCAGLLKQFSVNLIPIILPVVSVFISLLAAISFLLIERPAIRLGAKISKAWK